MTPDQLAALTEIVATIDRRLSGYEQRSINIEKNMAESATATDLIAENFQKMSESVTKLSHLYVSLDQNLEDLKTVMQNYVDAVREQLRQARQTEEAARGLTSEIRERFPKASGA